jgi:hypothetical protein
MHAPEPGGARSTLASTTILLASITIQAACRFVGRDPRREPPRNCEAICLGGIERDAQL